MSELTIKELKMYLDTGLRFKGKRKGWASFDSSIMTLCPIDLDGRFEIIKPLLHPLSSLTKEIEHNGEKFKPSHYISKHFKEAEDYILQLIICVNEKHEHLEAMLFYMPSCIREKLAEWHIDFQDLIGRGKALDKSNY